MSDLRPGPEQIEGFRSDLAGIRIVDQPQLVRARSRDFHWYSPILARELEGRVADLVVVPTDQDELERVLAAAYRHRVPLTLRGRGSGNYGQAVPLAGGAVVDMTGLDRILTIEPGIITAEAGCVLADLESALRAVGQELPVFSSTLRIATLGGFVGGGSSGVGSVLEGPLRERGNIVRIEALSVEAEPRRHLFEGEAVQNIHHAWGLNGVMTAITLRAVPARDWQHCVAAFPSYEAAWLAGRALAEGDPVRCRLASVVDAGFLPYLPDLAAHVPEGSHLLLALVERPCLEGFDRLVREHDGSVELALAEEALAECGLPPIHEFAYNHTTLQVLNRDRANTYLQIGLPQPLDVGVVSRLRAEFGDEVLMHHEFSRLGGVIQCSDLPVVRYSGEARLREVMGRFEAHGCINWDPHTYLIEGGGMKPDYRHLAWKKRLDPEGLLNPGKSRAWPEVQHLEPEQIEALGAASGATP